uniref:Uncharacterized protein n=1 Tax=Heterorhabditis bacteriophora TaxID=37862 RepID=A0A1I7XQC7_HETBA
MRNEWRGSDTVDINETVAFQKKNMFLDRSCDATMVFS